MKNFPWTNQQIALLKERYATAPRAELERELAPHSWNSICSTAKRLGVRRPQRERDWKAICDAHRPIFDFGRNSFK